MKRASWAAILLAITATLGLPTQAAAEDFPLKEYETHVQRYLASLENLSVEYSTTDHALDGTATFRDEYALISMPGHFRVKSSTTIEEKGKVAGPSIAWALLRPDGYYMIQQKAGGEFLLKGRQTKVTSPLLLDAVGPLQALMAPICDGNYPLIRLLRGEMGKRQVSKVKSFQRQSASKGTAYTLRTAFSFNGEVGDVDFELNQHWLIERATVISKTTGVRLITEIGYTSLGDRVLPARVIVKRIERSGKAKTPGFSAEFRNYQEYNGCLADFSLTQFGFPEAVDYHVAEPSRPWLYLVGAAILCLGLAVLLRRRYVRPAARSGSQV